MKRICLLMFVILLVGLPASAQTDENNRIKNAGKVMVEILNVPDDIPKDLLDKAECVIALPSVMKFAIGFGGSYGRGVMTCRSGKDFSGRWSAPSMMALEGGSFGLQLGGQATDFILLVMNQRGADSILTSQVKLGGDMAAAAGPKGRSAAASTDVTMRAEIVETCRFIEREDVPHADFCLTWRVNEVSSFEGRRAAVRPFRQAARLFPKAHWCNEDNALP